MDAGTMKAGGSRAEDDTYFKDTAMGAGACVKKTPLLKHTDLKDKHTDLKITVVAGGADIKKARTLTENADLKENVMTADARFKKTDPLADGETALSKLASWVGSIGVTALHCAAAAGLPRLAEALVKQGSLVTSRDALGNTPADVAACRGEVYCQKYGAYCARWYDDTRRTALRVWPVCKPRAFRRHSKLLHKHHMRKGFADTSDVRAAQNDVTGVAGGHAPSQTKTNTHLNDIRLLSYQPERNKNISVARQEISYQLTLNILSRHGSYPDISSYGSTG